MVCFLTENAEECMSAGGNNLGKRLLVILLGAGLVVLGMYPIRRHYGGAQGLWRRAFPSGVHWSLPEGRDVRSYLESLDHDRRRNGASESAARVKTVSVAPGAGERSGGSFLSGIFDFFRVPAHPAGGPAQGGPERLERAAEDRSPAERTMVAGSGGNDRTAGRAQLSPPVKPEPKPKQMDKLSQKDREELNKLIDGF